MSRNDRRYFYDFLEDYSEAEVLAYDLREILAEKVRVILTRKVQKLGDFYDLYLLYKYGLKVSKYKEAIIEKVVPVLRYEKYLENFRRNKASFNMRLDTILDEYELRLLNVEPDDNFVSFFNSLVKDIMKILDEIEI
ncbi:nucleotidyl transferase AbiEii/AbiGii toxin family protein [Thermococcus barophilus]|uniref:nucleotidyl transferase AbiEii/AbiGii toxin family protein n=1 Tax=Thermococcus barophilus TaxID=55802 RepID=UPI00130DB0ED|nr:nucleotidyl transferase AbiEii/AbiGii toxin family protein [Thermococcus barophilus]